MGSRAQDGPREEGLSAPSFSLRVVFDAASPEAAGPAVAGVLRALALARSEGWRLSFESPDVGRWLPALEEAVRGEGHGWNEPIIGADRAEFPADLRAWIRDRAAREHSITVSVAASALKPAEIPRLRDLGRLALACGMRWQ